MQAGKACTDSFISMLVLDKPASEAPIAGCTLPEAMGPPTLNPSLGKMSEFNLDFTKIVIDFTTIVSLNIF